MTGAVGTQTKALLGPEGVEHSLGETGTPAGRTLSHSGHDWTRASRGLGTQRAEGTRGSHRAPGGLSGKLVSEFSRRKRMSDTGGHVANSSLSPLLLGPLLFPPSLVTTVPAALQPGLPLMPTFQERVGWSLGLFQRRRPKQRVWGRAVTSLIQGTLAQGTGHISCRHLASMRRRDRTCPAVSEASRAESPLGSRSLQLGQLGKPPRLSGPQCLHLLNGCAAETLHRMMVRIWWGNPYETLNPGPQQVSAITKK